ncbi:hypothetical protein [Streptomyces flavofungini]|uniref:hypothetical protein n=1 Tax=Streptomyces flavofungini TaxID=68200 RepID=UPI0034DF4F92
MSITQDLRTRYKHRGLTPWQLVQKIGRLEREADSTACHLVAMATEIDELKDERGQLAERLDTAQIDLRGERAKAERLQAALTAAQAQLANATAVKPLPQHISTQPCPTVQQRFEAGPVVHLAASPLAAVTDPGVIRQASWGRGADDTQPIPAAQEAS